MFRILVLLTAVFVFSIPLSFGSHHFAEVYQTNGVWRVDHFVLRPGRLQEFVKGKSFDHKFQALRYAERIKALTQKSPYQIVSTESSRPLWNVSNVWSEVWETRYSEWVRKNFNKEFFVKHQLATDCADVAYALRWIFSRNNGLPAAATLAATGAVVTHLSAKTEWENLPSHQDWDKDERFLAALNWLLNNVYTKTLYVDGYPVKISRETVRPGLINLMDGHTEVFQQVSYDPAEVPMIVLSSTVPRAVRLLSPRVYMNESAWEKETGGFLQFRWPVKQNGTWKVIPKERMSNYSLEQYDENLCAEEQNFSLCLFEKLGIQFDPDKIYERLLKDIEDAILSRDAIVKEGHEYCLKNNCSPGTQGWEDHSTPTRDNRLISTSQDYSSLMIELGKTAEFYEWLKTTKLPVANNNLSYLTFYEYLHKGFVSYDPRDTLESRWASTVPSIVTTVTRKFVHESGLRNELVQKAEPCRQHPGLCKTKEAIDKFSSGEIDFKRRTMIFNLWDLCKRERCPTTYRSLTTDYESIWYESPIPWDSIAERTGKLPSRDKGLLLHADNVERIGSKYLLLDNNRIFDLAKRSEITLSPQDQIMGFDQFSKNLIVANGKEFVLIDEDLNEQARIEAPEEIGTSYIHFFGNGQALVYWSTLEGPRPSPNYDEYSAYLINFNDQTLQVIPKITRLIFDEDYAGVVYMQADQKMILEVDGRALKIVNVTLEENIKQLIYLKSNQYLIVLESQKAGILNSRGFVKVFEGESVVISSINSHLKRIEDFSPGGLMSIFVDLEGKIILKTQGMSSTKKISEEKTVFTLSETDDHSIWIADKGRLVRVPFNLRGDFALMFGASESWISIFSDNRIQLIDFKGNILENPSLFTKGMCYSKEVSACKDNTGELMYELFAPMTNGSILFTKVGPMAGTKISEPYAYVLDQSMNGPISSSEGSVMRWVAPKNSREKTIELIPGLLIWYP